MSSYRKINYSIRPAKNIERKMLSEAFRRLVFLDKLENYRYIGFGSTYFTDFELFHRDLNVKDMLSIEAEAGKKARFIFNRPFSCVDVKFDFSYNVLPTLEYTKKDIIWLDYDGVLNKSVFNDIDTVVSNVQAGSIFLISVNVETPRVNLCQNEKDNPIIRKNKIKLVLEELNIILGGKLNIKNELLPLNQNSILKKWNFAKKCREFISNQIEESLQSREIREKQGLQYQQLFNFHYSDDAKMLTVGGIIFDSSLKDSVLKCNFSELLCYKNDQESFLIDPPNLTYREIKYLNKYMSLQDVSRIPKDSSGNKIDTIVPIGDIEKFQKIYRYFPTFSESNL